MVSQEHGVLEAMSVAGHESVVFGVDPATGLRCIVAIHSTALGPALGGTRFFPYPDERSALDDVLRLSAGMTLKAAAAGLDLGGGKGVIIGDPDEIGDDELFEAYGRLVDTLAGTYVTAEDVGTTVADMVVVRRVTEHVKGLPIEMGGSGDPSPMTARGVLASMHAVADHLWNESTLDGVTVAVQGVGKVGAAVAELAAGEGARVVVADIEPEAVRAVCDRTGAEAVSPGEVLSIRCDILAPCALGSVLSARTIPDLRCSAVVGSANNQLANRSDADLLADAGILYAPDFVVNAGGIVNIAVEVELGRYSSQVAVERVDRIGDRLTEMLDRARASGVTPLDAAERLAAERLGSIVGAGGVG